MDNGYGHHHTQKICLFSFIDLALATPAPSSIVTIPATAQIKKQNESTSPSSATPTTAYITYSPQTTSTITNQNIQLVKSASGNYLITTPSPAGPSHQQVLRNIRISQTSPATVQNTNSNNKDLDNLSLSELQRQEQVLRIREAKLKCEVQEIEKEKAREELLQMREVHRMKIKEMETRLRNMERS